MWVRSSRAHGHESPKRMFPWTNGSRRGHAAAPPAAPFRGRPRAKGDPEPSAGVVCQELQYGATPPHHIGLRIMHRNPVGWGPAWGGTVCRRTDPGLRSQLIALVGSPCPAMGPLFSPSPPDLVLCAVRRRRCGAEAVADDTAVRNDGGKKEVCTRREARERERKGVCLREHVEEIMCVTKSGVCSQCPSPARVCAFSTQYIPIHYYSE